MRGLAQIVRHLHGENGAGLEGGQHARQRLEMVGHPLIDGVGKDQVDIGLGRPAGGVCESELQLGQTLAGRFEHGRRAVEADDLGVGIAFDQQFGGIARATAHVDDLARRRQRHLRQKIAGGTRPFVRELQVGGGRPVSHVWLLPSCQLLKGLAPPPPASPVPLPRVAGEDQAATTASAACKSRAWG